MPTSSTPEAELGEWAFEWLTKCAELGFDTSEVMAKLGAYLDRLEQKKPAVAARKSIDTAVRKLSGQIDSEIRSHKKKLTPWLAAQWQTYQEEIWRWNNEFRQWHFGGRQGPPPAEPPKPTHGTPRVRRGVEKLDELVKWRDWWSERDIRQAELVESLQGDG